MSTIEYALSVYKGTDLSHVNFCLFFTAYSSLRLITLCYAKQKLINKKNRDCMKDAYTKK